MEKRNNYPEKASQENLFLKGKKDFEEDLNYTDGLFALAEFEVSQVSAGQTLFFSLFSFSHTCQIEVDYIHARWATR